jgi:hypothetical protein
MSGLGTAAKSVSATAPCPLVAVSLAPEELTMLTSALDSAGLPIDDVTAPGRHFYSFEAPSGAVIGYGGFEIYEAEVLLRSILGYGLFRTSWLQPDRAQRSPFRNSE